jgi:hypothetical protein
MKSLSPLALIVGLLGLLPVGCQHVVLQRRTVQQASSLPDTFFVQVLNNIAAFSANPNTLPHFVYPSAGTTQTNRTVGSGSSFGWTGTATSFFFSGLSFTPNANQVTGESWTTNPSNEPEELLLMRCVYQRVVGQCSEQCETLLGRFFGSEHFALPAMGPGWYGVGCKHDVPKCAAYVGRWCDTYVWVMPEHVDNLSKLVIAMTDIATADPTALAAGISDNRVAELKARITYLSGILANYGTKEAPPELKSRLDALVRDYILAIKPPSDPNLRSNGQTYSTVPAQDDLPEGLIPPRRRKQEILFAPPLQPLQ